MELKSKNFLAVNILQLQYGRKLDQYKRRFLGRGEFTVGIVGAVIPTDL